MAEIEKILAGRIVVDTYRESHRQLHLQPWHKGIPDAHTPLLQKMKKDLKALGFETIDSLFIANKAIFSAEVFKNWRLEDVWR